jgi:hypothetical protein
MTSNQTITNAFIDMATFDELEKYMYGGPDAVTYFMMGFKPSTWFSLIPTTLTNISTPGFGKEWSASISRAGDYLLRGWVRANVPQVIAQPQGNANACALRWTHNFAHNLVKECSITFNDLIAARFDNYFLDFWAAFTVPASKQFGYNNMIGNTAALTNAQYGSNGFTLGNTLPAFTINLPLPFFFARDSGLALPTAALPYNEMRVNMHTRNWDELLVAYTAGNVDGVQATASNILSVGGVTGATLELSNAYMWAEYAIVSNDERKRMGCAPRDMLIEQVQTAPRATHVLGKNTNQDIRFSHSVKALFFAARNTTIKSEWSNYTVGNLAATGWVGKGNNVDTLSNATLLYENSQRLSGLPSDYYSLVEPWYKAPSIPRETGYHMYSYSLNMYDVNPHGSTNYGKLTNVTLNALGTDLTKTGGTQPPNATYELLIVALNHNVVRISGGALGFPVL